MHALEWVRARYNPPAHVVADFLQADDTSTIRRKRARFSYETMIGYIYEHNKRNHANLMSLLCSSTEEKRKLREKVRN